MAGCGEIDQTLTSSTQTESAGDPNPSTSPVECAICLQICVHPVRLPCHHVFCFLCVKGASWHSKRCALCRQEVPEGFLLRPTLLSPMELKAAAAGGAMSAGDGSRGDHAWYYEGHNGWWQYDERTGRELEEAFAKGRGRAEMLIAGFVYVADLEHMVQYRRNARGRRRRVKRDVVGIPKKGVAGLRLDPEPAPLPPAGAAAAADCVSTDMPSRSQFTGVGDVLSAAPSVRPPTLLGAPPDRPQSPSPPPSLEESLSQLLISQPEVEEDRALIRGQSCELASSEGATPSRGERSGGKVPGGDLGQPTPGRMPPRGEPFSSVVGGRSHSPDGQCTVTQE